MTLKEKALDNILEFDDNGISPANGVNTITRKLNRMYKKDEINEKFERKESTLQEFLVEFD